MTLFSIHSLLIRYERVDLLTEAKRPKISLQMIQKTQPSLTDRMIWRMKVMTHFTSAALCRSLPVLAPMISSQMGPSWAKVSLLLSAAIWITPIPEPRKWPKAISINTSVVSLCAFQLYVCQVLLSE